MIRNLCKSPCRRPSHTFHVQPPTLPNTLIWLWVSSGEFMLLGYFGCMSSSGVSIRFKVAVQGAMMWGGVIGKHQEVPNVTYDVVQMDIYGGLIAGRPLQASVFWIPLKILQQHSLHVLVTCVFPVPYFPTFTVICRQGKAQFIYVFPNLTFKSCSSKNMKITIVKIGVMCIQAKFNSSTSGVLKVDLHFLIRMMMIYLNLQSQRLCFFWIKYNIYASTFRSYNFL